MPNQNLASSKFDTWTTQGVEKLQTSGWRSKSGMENTNVFGFPGYIKGNSVRWKWVASTSKWHLISPCLWPILPDIEGAPVFLPCGHQPWILMDDDSTLLVVDLRQPWPDAADAFEHRFFNHPGGHGTKPWHSFQRCFGDDDPWIDVIKRCVVAQ